MHTVKMSNGRKLTYSVAKTNKYAIVNGKRCPLIGWGMTRKVFRYSPNLVIKIGYEGHNRKEVIMWKMFRKKDRKYFAKPIMISKDGTVLIQRLVGKSSTKDKKNHYKLYGQMLDIAIKYVIADIFSDHNWRPVNGIPVCWDFSL